MNVTHKVPSGLPTGTVSGKVAGDDWRDDHLGELNVSLGAYVVMTNLGASYDAVDVTRGLGRVTADWTGVSQIDLNIQVKHVGAGAHTWQLWNETDAVAIGTISD